MLACSWVKRGYKSVNGYLTKDGAIIPTPEEKDFFNLIGVPYIEPEHRHL
jgi:DNA polymerase/3'-5' exonuclease PolX